MAYAKIENGTVVKYPYTVADMQTDFPEVDFSTGLTDEVLASCSAVEVQMGPIPTHSSSTHIFNTTVEVNEDGSATAVITATERRFEEAALNLRHSRDIALQKTDWVITRAFEEGNPVPTNYVTYRNALRDLPSQEGFPYDYVWPILEI
jgi:hypothetical protein